MGQPECDHRHGVILPVARVTLKFQIFWEKLVQRLMTQGVGDDIVGLPRHQ